ncbi:GGDEF domain-containing protein [uncultured Halopseudomonas sp.]|uniref:GGDEF domain-containing protein n=1 Tax=uncultured Halopseudomonas sp. TaxID=2901193 RepID=UPI0030EF286C|tara:strand:+ start:14236 stop:15165 length:930 start_codon:yes stop_codon:yes gene_type:complete
MTLTQGNTIDFDSARLKLSENMTSVTVMPAENRQLSLTAVQDKLTRSLQTTLELDRVLELFFQELRAFMGLDCLEYRLEGRDLHQRIGQSSLHRCSYRMTHAGSFLGEIQFSRKKRFNETHLKTLETLLGNLLYPLRNALLYREAAYCAHNDSLTGVGNRLAMDRALDREVKLSIRNRSTLSLLVLDIDYFKQINDQYGHACGDEALKAVVNCVRNCLRGVDDVFRMGGEEFVVLLSDTAAREARMVAERIRSAIEEMQFQTDGVSIAITASIGVATRRLDEGNREVLDRCDKLMYSAKRGGRNRIAVQ